MLGTLRKSVPGLSPDEKANPRKGPPEVLRVKLLANSGRTHALAASGAFADRIAVAQEQEPEADLCQEVQDQVQEYLAPLADCPEALGPASRARSNRSNGVVTSQSRYRKK